MAVFNLKKGRNLKIKGQANKEIVEVALPAHVAIQPQDFRGLKPRLAVAVGDSVKRGSAILTDKVVDGLQICSPVSGTVSAINRGAKRALISVVIETSSNQEAESFQSFSESEISSLKKDVIVDGLCKGGLWPVLRQRPFSNIANKESKPKAIFIHAMNTEPLAADVDYILEGREKEFQVGIDILTKLVDGNVYLCRDTQSKSKALTEARNVEQHQFSGPHPTGNVSTHIQHVDPLTKGEVVWYIEAADVLKVAFLFLNGAYPNEKIVAITGEGAKNKVYAKTVEGAPISTLLQGSNLENVRCISGSVLAGRDVSQEGYVGFYHSQITAIPEGGNREFLGWLVPGFNKYTLSHTYASAFVPKAEFSVDTDENGGHRAIVLNHLYDELISLDIVTYFLLKAIISGEIDDAEKLGILECDEEDFALCTFACPSKTDVGAIIRKGLDLIEKEE